MRRRYWRNWIGNQTTRARIRAPKTLAELQQAVREGAARGRVRSIGHSFAWSELVPTPDTLIDFRHLNRVLEVDTASTVPTITTECGISIEALTRVSSSYGLTLVSPTIFPRVSVGGVASTSSHGTGRNVSTFSDGILAMTVVDANGEIREFKAGDSMIDAARAALGCFGAVYSVKLRTERAFNVQVDTWTFPSEEVLDGLPDILATYEFVEMYWFPFASIMWVMGINRVDQPAQRLSFGSWLRKQLLDGLTLFSGRVVIPIIANNFPRLTPLMLEIAPDLAFSEGRLIEPSAVQFHYQSAYPKIWDMSFSVPIKCATDSWRLIMGMIEEYREQGKFPVNFVTHARYIGPSSGLISMAEGRATCMIEVVTGFGTPEIESYYRDLEHRFYSEIPTARPHWGKLIYDAEAISAQYTRAKWNHFLQLRETFDPDRVFLNRWLEEYVFKLPRRGGE